MRFARFVDGAEAERAGRPGAYRLGSAFGTAALAVFLLLMWPGSARASAALPIERSCSMSAPALRSAAVSASSGASITLSRTRGPAGTSLQVSGTGWPAAAHVTIDADGVNGLGQLMVGVPGVAQAIVMSDGAFITPAFEVPMGHSCVGMSFGTAGTVAYFVAHTADSSVSAQAQFDFVAPPRVVTDSPGQDLQVDATLRLLGAQWEPGASIVVASSMYPGALGTPRSDSSWVTVPGSEKRGLADATGSFSFAYSIPASLAPRDTLRLSVTGTGPLYGAVTLDLYFQILPAIMPSVTLDRASGVAGARVSVVGQHWQPGDAVTIEYCRGWGNDTGAFSSRCAPAESGGLGAATADQGGRFQVQVTIPAEAWIGPITIQARVPGDVFGLMVYAQTAPFTIVPIQPAWETVHPRLALLEKAGVVAFALLALLCIGLEVRRRRVRPARSLKA